MGYNAGPPPKEQINYDNAALLEQAIRDAAREYGFLIESVDIQAYAPHAPLIVVKMRQVIRRET